MKAHFRIALGCAIGILLLSACSTASENDDADADAMTPTSVPTEAAESEYDHLFADPDAPLYNEETGFDEDSQRLLFLFAFQHSLQAFLEDNGSYPDSLNKLFPEYEIRDEHGEPIEEPPVAPDDTPLLTYVRAGDGGSYTLSVETTTGEVYEVESPAVPDIPGE